MYVERPIQLGQHPFWWDPPNPKRIVGHLLFNGLRDGADASRTECLVCFQHGKDVQLITAQAVCGPLCGYNISTLRNLAAWGTKKHVHLRTTTVFYGGRIDAKRGEGDNTGRAQMLLHHKGRHGWRIINTAGDEETGEISVEDKSLFKSYAEEASRSEFCYSPLGSFAGDTDRYVAAILFGCIPIMLHTVLGNPMSQPLDEVINWSSFAVLVGTDDIEHLHDILAEYTAERKHAMRKVMQSVWHRFLYTSIYGSYLNESGKDDAFETMLQVLESRVSQQIA